MRKSITILVMAMYTIFMGMFLIGELIEKEK